MTVYQFYLFIFIIYEAVLKLEPDLAAFLQYGHAHFYHASGLHLFYNTFLFHTHTHTHACMHARTYVRTYARTNTQLC